MSAFAVLTAIRIAVVTSYFAFQSSSFFSPSHHLKINEAGFLSLTGVRGTLSMIFALSTLKYSYKGYLTVEEGELSLRYAGGVIVLSLLLGGGPAELYLQAFQLTQKISAELAFIDPFLNARIREAVYLDFENSKSDYGSAVDLEEIVKFSSLLSSKSTDLSAIQASVDRLNGDRPLNHELYLHIRNCFMGALRSNYMGYIEKRMLPRYSYAASVLLSSVDIVISDHDGHSIDTLGDWKIVSDALTISPTLKWLYGNLIDPIMGLFRGEDSATALQALEALLVKRSIYTLSAFVNAHEKAQKYMDEMFGGDFTGVITAAHFPEFQRVMDGSRHSVSTA